MDVEYSRVRQEREKAVLRLSDMLVCSVCLVRVYVDVYLIMAF